MTHPPTSHATGPANSGLPAPAAPADLAAVLSDYVEVTQRLANTHEVLQREVLRLRGEIERKNEELERRRRLAALGELAAGVAHEVRNPLAAIQLYSGLLRRECGADGEALTLIDKIESGVRAIDGVVQDALALAPRGGRLQTCDLRCIVRRAQDLCRHTLDDHGIRLVLVLPEQEALVLADEDALPRVLVNLLANAAQASPPGTTVTVTLELGRPGWIDLHVADEGCGISPDLIDRIFDPFFTTKRQGTGLGLTIAHRLVEAHGGRVTVRNRAGRGAEFIVTLPRVEPGAAPAAAREPEFSAA